LTKLRLNLCSLKSAKILKYGPGIYKQFLFGSTNSILCSIYGTVQDCKDISPIQIPLHCLPRILLLVFYFPITRVLCHIADIYETQACAVTLNTAPVFNLGKLPVDATILALIFRQVNR